MSKKIIAVTGLLALSVFIFSCSKNNSPANDRCANITSTFSADVNPIIQTYCNQPGCHFSGSVNGPGSLTNYTEVFGAKDRIRTQIDAGLMPQNTTLTLAQRNKIICWIDSGAPNN